MMNMPWQTLAEGTCIGHQRIHRLPLQQAEALRLIITQGVGMPMIKQLTVYHTRGTD